MEPAESIWRPLGELLLEKGLVTPDELELALAEQADSNLLLGAILVERGYVSGPALAVVLAEQYGVELDTEGGVGTGPWAKKQRRRRAGRGHGGPDDVGPDDVGPDNVLKLEPVAPPLEIVPHLEPDPDVEWLGAENRRLQDELERLRGELTNLGLVESPKQIFAHLLFVPTPARYVLLDREGAPPARGEELDVPEAEARFVVTKVGRAPYPGELRPCAYLMRLS